MFSLFIFDLLSLFKLLVSRREQYKQQVVFRSFPTFSKKEGKRRLEREREEKCKKHENSLYVQKPTALKKKL